MSELSWEDFIADLCRDTLNGIDRTRIMERTKLSDNTLSCFCLRTKPQIPNMKQWGIILDEAFKQRPENVRQAQKRWCARFGMMAESLEVLRAEVGRITGG